MDYRVVLKDKSGTHSVVIPASCAAEAETIALRKNPNKTIFDICRCGDCGGKSKREDGDED